MSAPPSRLRTGSRSAPATARSIIFTSGGKWRPGATEDGAATIKEPGTQEFVSSVGQKEKNHVFIFEVFNNTAAWDAHQKTAAYAKFLGLTMMMIKTYDIRPFASVALNKSGAPQPQAD